MIDANGTRMRVLLGERDWKGGRLAGGAAEGTEWDERCGALMLSARPVELGDVGPGPGAAATRRGAGRDWHGSVYWIDGDGRLLVQSSGTGRVSVFWPGPAAGERSRPAWPGDFAPAAAQPATAPVRLQGVAVDDCHQLLVGTGAPAGLLVFDLRGGGPPQRLAWAADAGFAPFALAPRPGGGVAVLQRAPALLWLLDRALAVDPPVPPGPDEPAAGGFVALPDGDAPPTRRPMPRRARAADAIPLSGDPVAVAAAHDGSVVVVDAAGVVNRIVDGIVEPVGAVLAGPSPGGPVRPYDAVLLAPATPAPDALGTLVVELSDEPRALAFTLTLSGGLLSATPVTTHLPLRRPGPGGLVPAGRHAAYETGGRWVSLAEQPRPRHVPAAEVVTEPLDGREPGCVWHRVLLDALVPQGAAVSIATRAADRREDVTTRPWNEEPAPRRRGDGSELPLERPGAADRFATWETLVQRGRGQWLQVRLRLSGDGRATPRVRAMRVHFPRFSYLEQYLPKVYRDDTVSAGFLDRYLANVEGLNTALEDRVATAHALFDPAAAPPGALDWLAGWFDVALDPAWDEGRRRLFLAHAMTCFAQRGTANGLRLALRLALDPCVDERAMTDPSDRHTQAFRIVERFRGRSTPLIVLGDVTAGALPRMTERTRRWSPAQGADALHERWRAYRAAVAGSDPPAGEPYPLVAPEGLGPVWRRFSAEVLGIVPAGPSAEPARWAAFLARRHGTPAALSDAYGLAGGDRLGAWPDDAPAELPPDGPELADWWDFETAVVARAAVAHRFTVLLPVPVAGDEPPEELERRHRGIAERVVRLQRPAHTVFDVRFYWSAFRLGEARLGLDTAIDVGSRSGRLLPSAVLGRRHLGESVLAGDVTRGLDP